MIIQDLLIPASTTDTCRLSFFLGILLHITAFRRGEWHLYTLHLIAVIVIISGSATAALTILGPDNGKSVAGVAAAARAVATVLSTCVLGIFSSTLAYRAFLHRLGPFRGPFLARLSSLYMTFLSYKNFHLFDEVHRLHAQYGDIVRVGKAKHFPNWRVSPDESMARVPNPSTDVFDKNKRPSTMLPRPV